MFVQKLTTANIGNFLSEHWFDFVISLLITNNLCVLPGKPSNNLFQKNALQNKGILWQFFGFNTECVR